MWGWIGQNFLGLKYRSDIHIVINAILFFFSFPHIPLFSRNNRKNLILLPVTFIIFHPFVVGQQLFLCHLTNSDKKLAPLHWLTFKPKSKYTQFNICNFFSRPCEEASGFFVSGLYRILCMVFSYSKPLQVHTLLKYSQFTTNVRDQKKLLTCSCFFTSFLKFHLGKKWLTRNFNKF